MGASKPSAAKPRSSKLFLPDSIRYPGEGHKWQAKVACDFHNVIVNWDDPIAEFINKIHPDAKIDPSKHRFYDIGNDPTTAISPREWQDLFPEFCASTPGYGGLPIISGMREQLWEIHEAGIGIEIMTYVPGVASVLSDSMMALRTGVAQRQTIELIESLDLPIDIRKDVKFVAPHEKPRRMSEKHIPLLIEDNAATAALARNMGLATLLVPMSSNQITCPNVLRLKSRDEVALRTIEFFKPLREAGLLLEGRR
jgi:hypothetical protein